jgi:hypothetical protein
MGWRFHDIETLPDPDTIVWCRWPQREDKGMPGRTVRPVLVRESMLMEHADGFQFGDLIVSYATGEFTDEHAEKDLIIRAWEFRDLGLHKPTRFSMNPSDRKRLPWCEEYFVPPEYVLNAGIVIGKLTPAQIARKRVCLQKWDTKTP